MGHLNSGGIGDPLKSMKDKERWRELCEQAAVEQDPKKLMVMYSLLVHNSVCDSFYPRWRTHGHT